MSGRRTAGIAALTVTATIALAACTGGAAVSDSAPSAADGTQTITYLIGQPDNPGDLDKIKQSIATFEAQEKNVKVKLNTLPTDQLRTVLQTQLRSGKGPDIFGYDTGPGFAGVLASAGLLYDLTSAY